MDSEGAGREDDVWASTDTWRKSREILGGLAPPPRPGKERRFGLFPVIIGNGEDPRSFMEKREDLTAYIFSVNKKCASRKAFDFNMSFVCTKECATLQLSA